MNNLTFDETQSRIRQKAMFTNRLLFAGLIVFAVFCLFMARMAYLQWFNHEEYLGLSEGNRISVEPLAPERGKIYDRNGVILVDNQPVYSLSFMRESIYDIDYTINAIQELLPSIRPETLAQFKTRLKRTPRHRAIILPYTLDESEAARFAVNSYRFSGIALNARLKRVYTQNKSAVHLLGYVGRISQQDNLSIDRSRYRGTDIVGKTGIEHFYEDKLQGYPGLQRIETNAQGRTIRSLETIPPTSGENLTLTIDIRLQKYLENLFEGRRGAAVAIDPENGEILAFVSSPMYNPNLFVDGISHTNYNSLLHDRNKPLINRASRGQYPPGSTTKPFIGLGALEQGFTTMSESIFDPGYFEYQNRRYRNWRRDGHGWADLKRSIVESVDTYYYKLSLDMGIDSIHDILAPFGFGSQTGVDIPGEANGILPSQAWKMATYGKAWFRGETIISSIGQGFNLATPLQLAKAASILANRGRIINPHALKGQSHESPEQIPIKNREHWEYIIDAMTDAVHTPRGTAWSSGRHITGYKIAGKTGTAQVFSLNDGEYNEEELDKRLHDHSLFIGFGPVTRPKIAISVIVENAGGGSRVAAPLALQAMNHYIKELQ
ncbi:penicillin-binding protein 2 [Thiomicrospira pelophila]|uniref:penicillin-binding protein 2 n=1 Tax=Thiomicrospira pelophila TaxID=934 RepID=UPI0004A720C6|nr:penicillin-binding protein 2 [Thiomicrospira pelophila]